MRLVLVKSLHTFIWAAYVWLIGYVLVAGIAGPVTPMVWGAIALILLEGIVLLSNHRSCPLTSVAAHYTEERADNFDIFLPLWLARHNKAIFTPIAVAGILLVAFRALR